VVSANLLVAKSIYSPVIPTDENGEATGRALIMGGMSEVINYQKCAIDYNDLVAAVSPYVFQPPEGDDPAEGDAITE